MAGKKAGSKARFFPEVGAAKAKDYLVTQGNKPGCLHLLEARRQTNGKVLGTLVIISDKPVSPPALYQIAERFREQLKQGQVSQATKDMRAAAASGDFSIQRAVPKKAATAGRPPAQKSAKKKKPQAKSASKPAKKTQPKKAPKAAVPAAKKATVKKVAPKAAPKKTASKKAPARRSAPDLPPPMPAVHPDYEQQLQQQTRYAAEMQSVGLGAGVSGYPVRTEPLLTTNGYVIGTGVDVSIAPSRPQDAYDWSYGGGVGTIGAPAVDDNFDHAWARFVEQTRAGINRSTGVAPVHTEIMDGVGGYSATDWYP